MRTKHGDGFRLQLESEIVTGRPKNVPSGYSIKCVECGKITTHGKKYCLIHVFKNPQAKLVRRELDLREEDMNYRSKIRWDSTIFTDILLALRSLGPQTTAGLGRLLNLETKVVNRFTSILARRRIVRIGETRRGAILVELR